MRVHRRVLGVSGDVEVLTCGHQVPRFDRTLGFQARLAQNLPAFPRLRACPVCPSEPAVFAAAFRPVNAPMEALVWWSGLGLPARATWLDEVLPQEDTRLLRGRLPRIPLPDLALRLLERALHLAQVRADEVGLTLRELQSCSASPLPVLNGWALTRAAARRFEAVQAQAPEK